MNSTEINPTQCTTESIMNTVHNLTKKLPTILHSCLICNNLIKGSSARKTAQCSENIKTFCEFFSLNKITCFDFENRLTTSLLCHICRGRISLIAKVVREVNRLNKQLDTLRKSVCSDLACVNSLLPSSVLEDVNKSKQENQCEINMQQKFRKRLEERLAIPILRRSISLVHSTREASDDHRDCNNLSSFDHAKSVESHDDYVNSNAEVADKITITVFPLSSNSSDRPVAKFQGVDYMNTESDKDFPEICQTSLDTIADNSNDFNSFATHDREVFDEEDIKIENNDGDSSDFEMTAVDEILTNSATDDIESSNANSEANIEFDINRMHGDRNDTRNSDTFQKIKNVSEPTDIGTQPPAEPPIQLKNAVVILTRLSPRSVAKLSRSNVQLNQTKTGGLVPVSINSDDLTCSSDFNSDQDTNPALDSIIPSNNELNSDAGTKTLRHGLIASPLPEASTTAADIEVEQFSEFSDTDGIVEVEVATETDTKIQDVCESTKAPPSPAASNKLNARKTVRKFQCPFVDPVKGYCPKKGRRFINQQRLDAHLNRMHYGNDNKKHRQYKCKQCGVKVNSYKSLGEHEKIHIGMKDLICKTCAKSFRTVNSLLFHQRKVHGALYPFVCDVCSKGFNFASLLRAHMRSHTGELRFRCEECKAGFCYQSALNNHIILIHASERQSAVPDVCESDDKALPAPSILSKLNARKALLKFECPFVDPATGYCPKRGRRYIDQERLDAHLNRMHYGKKDHEYQCKQCHVSVNTYKRLIEHEKLHSGVKDWICRTCAESFRTEKFLLFHQRKVHGELYPFLCDVCSKGFNFACHLRLHMLSHAGEFKFRCEECKAGFHHKSALDNHTIIHASERQFSCECCSKKFTSKGGLTVHMTTHLEDKAWLCDTCGKSFRSRDGLTKHWEVHRTVKSYACQLCDFKTKTKACLGNHSRRYCKNRKKT